MTLTLKFKDGREQAYDAVVLMKVDDKNIHIKWWTPSSGQSRIDIPFETVKGFILQ
jgi:hypothetical protein